jgi:hypothetical protein
MSHVFLSYAREDQDFAVRLARAIEARGETVWWDRSVPPGKTFDEVIEEALERAHAVVVLWSASSVRSNWMRAEADEAFRRGLLVPVLIEEIRPPLAFRRIEAAELQGWTGEPDTPELQQLLRVLEQMRSRGPIPAPPRQPASPLPAVTPQAHSAVPAAAPHPLPRPAPPPAIPAPRRRVPVWLRLVFLGIGLLLLGACAITMLVCAAAMSGGY